MASKAMARRRTSMGRQKIEIRRIESEEARQVCFSKRRAGLFKKASELAILCGAEVAAVVFSPAGKAFSFGHPSVEAIIERFDPTGPVTGGGGGGAVEDNTQVAELNRQYGELTARLDEAKGKKERIEAAMANHRAAGSPVAAWLEADLRDMGENELMEFAAALQEVQAVVAARANQVLQEALNHGRAMAARNRSNMVPLAAPQQQQLLLGMGVGGNGGFDFGAGSSSGANNGTEMDMQMQLMMAMTPPPTPGFSFAGMEMLMQQGFGGFPFPGPY